MQVIRKGRENREQHHYTVLLNKPWEFQPDILGPFICSFLIFLFQGKSVYLFLMTANIPIQEEGRVRGTETRMCHSESEI